MLARIFELALLRQALRIEHAAPRLEGPAADADVDFAAHAMRPFFPRNLEKIRALFEPGADATRWARCRFSIPKGMTKAVRAEWARNLVPHARRKDYHRRQEYSRGAARLVTYGIEGEREG